VTHDPYFSVWSPADRLTDAATTHWTGKPHPLASLIRIDGRTYRLMGIEPADVPPFPQIEVRVLPTRTLYRFADPQVALTLSFVTPALPSDLNVLARPVTYVNWEACSADGKPHTVQVYFDAGAALAVNSPEDRVVWERPTVAGLDVLKLGSKDQRVLARKGDDLRIDWGYLYLAAEKARAQTAVASGAETRKVFAQSGDLGDLPRNEPVPEAQTVRQSDWVLAARFDLGEVGAKPVGCQAMLAYDDLWPIKYFGTRLRPYWRRGGAEMTDVLRAAAEEYSALAQRCCAFDEDLVADLVRVGGDRYALVCALAYRQTWAGNKLAADAAGQPLLFPKENFSNGCISTVDVLFPQAPMTLVFSPALTKAMLVPILDYAASPAWPYGYAPHDLGTYPHATGQVYGMSGGDGNRMPVEESGNMLIMLAALARAEGNAEFAKKYWPTLTCWADYLVANGLDPENQLCSADMFGHLPHCANLALKAILGIGGYAQLCALAGKPEESARYMSVARQYAAKWQEMARDDGRTRLAYHLPGTWGMKHNLIWDRVLGLGLFPDAVGDAEVAWYLKVQNQYGLPVDNRTPTSLIDWATWSIAPARDRRQFEALFEPIFRYADETPSRVPLSDWYFTTDGRQRGFQARPVVGGIFVKLLADPAAWKKWAGQAQAVGNDWSAPPIAPPVGPQQEIVATARQQPIAWRYTLEPPADNWFQPDFDDSSWRQGPAGFGTEGTPGAVVRTHWDGKQIWLRREFTLGPETLISPRLVAHCDEDGVVYLNGKPAAEMPGYTTRYESLEIDPAALATLKPGKNVLAVYAQQSYGGQYIDVGFTDTIPGAESLSGRRAALPPLQPLFDFPVRDTSVCLGGDGNYYLTGTTGFPTWWKTNEGIRVWRSADLKQWTPLGLVWRIDDGTWQKQFHGENRAVWAPEIHYFRDTYWITFSMNFRGCGLLRSTSGKAEGPYVDVHPQGPITGNIDASLFCDDDGKVYWVYQNGLIARMNDDLTDLAEKPRLLQPSNYKHVGFEGAYLTRHGGRYYLIAAEFLEGQYHCMVASAEQVYGPYGLRYVAVPHGGHNMFFTDKQGQWWATFFGNDPKAPFRERPAVLRIELDAQGRIQPQISSCGQRD